jgi:predicted nucleotide-binding protein
LKAGELLDRFRAFQAALISHRSVWGSSLTMSTVVPPEIKANHRKTIEDQIRSLTAMLTVLNPYINEYALVRLSGIHGQRYDIFLTAVLDSVALRKAAACAEAIPLLDGIIARLELEPADVEVGVSQRPQAERRIFISHGTQTDALDKVERFIRTLGPVPVIVKHEPSGGAAVDDMVPALMESCDAVVVLATSDEAVGDRRQPRPNVLHEIGLAQEKLKGRVIYLKETGCTFPSNINPKIWEDFTQTDLAPAFMKIAKELKAFKLI